MEWRSKEQAHCDAFRRAPGARQTLLGRCVYLRVELYAGELDGRARGRATADVQMSFFRLRPRIRRASRVYLATESPAT